MSRAIKEASKLFLVLVIIDPVDKIDHLNVCVGNFVKCFDGSESPFHFPCSLILIVTFLFVSPMYTSPHERKRQFN